jgi:hydantoinase/carbamoylase family amidase
MTVLPAIDARRVIADLRELDRRTGGPDGAQRLCWGDGWREARALLTGLLGEIGLTARADAAGNLWASLEGEQEPALALGSHLDSVPDGGWLDGALGVMAALDVLRAWGGGGGGDGPPGFFGTGGGAAPPPPPTLTLVDWADEEGARFGRSLFGSSAFSGTLHPAEVRDLRDREGHRLTDVLAENSVDLDLAPAAASRVGRLAAYLELHTEQGPVLEAEGLRAAAVNGCAGVERHRFRFSGQASHAGTTPMGRRRDAGLAAAELTLGMEEIARRHAGVATAGALTLRPGIPTAVAGEAELLVDLRHPEADELATMLDETRATAEAVASERGCELRSEPVWRIEPIPFNSRLVAAAREACREAADSDRELTSGALHDAAEVARVLPAAMIFCPSAGGISHAKEEDTPEPDLAAGIETFGLLANRVLAELPPS